LRGIFKRNRQQPVLADHLVGAPFRFQHARRLERGGIQVDGGTFLAQVETDGGDAEMLDEHRGKQVLSAVLLHVIEAAVPIDAAIDLIIFDRRRDQVRDGFPFIFDRHQRHAADRTCVMWLPTGSGIKRAALQINAASIIGAAGHPCAEFPQIGIGVIESLGHSHQLNAPGGLASGGDRSQCYTPEMPHYRLLVLTTALAATAFAQRTLIRAGHVLNVHTGEEPADQTIVVTGDRITAISATASTPAQPGDREIDLRALTVLPGLIDVHTHLTFGNEFDPYARLSTDAVREALNGVRFAKITLEAGFTTVRNVGASGYADVALRDYINAGFIPGPHMQVSGPPLSITGGHCDNNFLPAEYHATSEGVADGIAAVQQHVRQNIKYGVDLIKVCATGGVLSKGDDPQASQYSLEELKALVADAHRLGRKVAAHAHGAEGILFATQAGVDSIEHGTYVDADDIAAMKQHGTWLVPTLYLIDWMRENGHLPAMFQQKMLDVSAVVLQNQKKAVAAGVRVALGTDAAVYPHGLNAHEVEVYVTKLGMTPLAALQTGTINAAELMGWTDRTGALDAGKWADVIAVEGDPLRDVRTLQHVRFVMKAGVIYKQ